MYSEKYREEVDQSLKLSPAARCPPHDGPGRAVGDLFKPTNHTQEEGKTSCSTSRNGKASSRLPASTWPPSPPPTAKKCSSSPARRRATQLPWPRVRKNRPQATGLRCSAGKIVARLEAVIAALEASPDFAEVGSDYGREWRWHEKTKTPAWAQEKAWPRKTYWRHVFVMVIGRKVLLRINRCPWLATQDRDSTNKHVLEVIKDPRSVFK